MVYQTPHPVHRDWAQAAGMALHPWLPRPGPYPAIPLRDLDAALHVPRCDVAVAEGGGPAGACALANRIGRVKRAVVLAADETWSRLRRGVPSPLPRGERWWWRAFSGWLDGAIAVSPYVRDDLKVLLPDLPVEVVRPHVLQDVRKSLETIEPALEGSKILHISHASGKNGTAVLMEAFAEVRRHVPAAELHIIGDARGTFGDRPSAGVVEHGRVESIAPLLRDSALFALPGLGQASPVSTLEAMVAGVPALVSTETGTKDIVAGVDTGLVAGTGVDAITEAILDYLELGSDKRRELGRRARRLTSDLTPENQGASFERALASLAAVD